MDRNEIINRYGKLEFENFLKSNDVTELLNEEGLKILNESPRREERIDYILAFSPQLQSLFKNDLFCELFLSCNISYFCLNIERLSYESVEILMNKLVALNKTTFEIASIFAYFSEELKVKIIESKTLPMELIYEIFKVGRIPDRVAILENYDIDLTSHDINLYGLFYNGKHSVLQTVKSRNLGLKEFKPITVPSHLITKEVAEKIWDSYDIFEIRAILNDAAYCTNPETISNYVKRKEEELIYEGMNGLMSPLTELYNSVIRYYELEEYLNENRDTLNDEDFNNLWRESRENRKFYQNHKYFNRNKTFYEKLERLYEEKGLDGITEAFELENHKMLSNYIIDYHFEENYHNIKLDVDELLGFYFRGNIDLPEEFIEIYQKISNIDYLSLEEKLELHEELKEYNMIERFYDDMSFARHIVRETIKEYSLTNESLQQFLDEELTKEYGVPVYNVKEEPFFGVVKSGAHNLDRLPTGHSFSLVGNNCVSIFGSPDASNTYLYDVDNLSPDQIVHVFPRDSFTIYRPFDAITDSTDRVNTLLTAPELISASTSYNEVLILEQGKDPHPIDKDIETMKRIALYCIDKISEKDVIEAKREGVGILLVSSRLFNHDYETRQRISNLDYQWDYNYFNGIKDKDKYEARRM